MCCDFSSIALKYYFNFTFNLAIVIIGCTFPKHWVVKIPEQHQSQSIYLQPCTRQWQDPFDSHDYIHTCNRLLSWYKFDCRFPDFGIRQYLGEKLELALLLLDNLQRYTVLSHHPQGWGSLLGLTSTGFPIYQLKPSCTVTFVAYNQVSADMGTSTIVNQAFIYIWNKNVIELLDNLFQTDICPINIKNLGYLQ